MISHRHGVSLILLACMTAFGLSSAQAQLITSGSATLSFDTTALYNDTTLTVNQFLSGLQAQTFTSTQVLSSTAYPSTGLDLNFSINGASVTNPGLPRDPQTTNLDFGFAGYNSSNPLASWSSSSASGFAITGGEQIGLNGIVTYNSPYGALVTGDFALRYEAGRAAEYGQSAFSGLVLVNMYQIPASTFDIGNAQYTVSGDTLTIPGNLLISPEFSNAFFGGTITGDNVGTFSITASAVPEASTMVMSLLAGTLFVGRLCYSQKRRKVD